MTPFSFEWQWNIDYFLFMGLLYLALVVVGGGLAFAYIKTWLDVNREEGPEEGGQEISSRSRYSDF